MKVPFIIGLHNYSNSTLSSADLKIVPADIPLDIVRLDLSRNNIKRLRPKEFVSVKDLKLLNLSGNSLESIDTGEARGTQQNPVIKTYTYLMVEG